MQVNKWLYDQKRLHSNAPDAAGFHKEIITTRSDNPTYGETPLQSGGSHKRRAIDDQSIYSSELTSEPVDDDEAPNYERLRTHVRKERLAAIKQIISALSPKDRNDFPSFSSDVRNKMMDRYMDSEDETLREEPEFDSSVDLRASEGETLCSSNEEANETSMGSTSNLS